MASAAHDYQHFVRWLHVPETGASEGARRIANLMLNNFDAVGASTRNLSQRAIHIAELARDQFARTNSVREYFEYAPVGAVDEGAQKRIDAGQYLRNVHEGRFESPRLRATDLTGHMVTIQADADAYRFCFIKKNRIDSFSRTAAKAAGQKNELIAALFGMDH
ncbi:hypothetical protein [Pseudomonas sp. 24 R 17]|uniref:hypothetical protein n=1 Tax=Pseudomonas sp. 24 R 17 TaxID=1844096 RepID=UPI000812BE63|nr:hypothetical protein [Pseudomonas sp. 24 R 17]CRM38654.1 hypothetical protein [Pseudomonas sp. 24 R 17]